MAKLAAWSMNRKGGEEDAQPPVPKRIARPHIGPEKDFENWNAKDVTLIGRQARAAVILRECKLAGAGGADP